MIKNTIKFNRYQALLTIVMVVLMLLANHLFVDKLPLFFRALWYIAFSIWLDLYNPFRKLDTWLKKKGKIK